MHGPYSNEYYASGRSSIGKVYWDETKDDPEWTPDDETLWQQELNRIAIHGDDT